VTYDLRTLADGAADAWDSAPESHKPILRDCADALIEAADELDRRMSQLKEWTWHPSLMSGWDAPGCPDAEAAAIREACEIHGVEVPEHLIETR